MLEFYKCLNKEGFKNLAKQMFSLFGSTYICEQTFSVMNFNKNKHRPSLTDGHLEDTFKISSSSILIDYDVLSQQKMKHFTLNFLRFVLTIDLLSMLAINLTF